MLAPQTIVSLHTITLLAFVVGVACVPQPSHTLVPEAQPSCHECTTVSGRVLSINGEPISSANVLPVPRAAAPIMESSSFLAVDSEGQFSLTLTGFGARPLLFGADGFVSIGTIIYADGTDAQLEVRLARTDVPRDQSSVSYVGPMTDTRHLGELQDAALCHPGLRECPPHAQRRAIIEKEIERTKTVVVRIPLWMAYLSSRKSLAELHVKDNDYAHELLNTLEPTSWRWVEDPNALVVATRVTGDENYFIQAFRKHPDSDMPILLLRAAQTAALDAGTQNETERLKRLDRLANDPRVKDSKLNRVLNHGKPLATRGPQVGDTLPDFTAATITGDCIDADHLPGKLTLIHFWGTWCSACKDDLPLFHELIAAFGNLGFSIVSFAEDEKPEDVALFRADRWPMPWHHVVLTPGQTRVELETAFDLTTFPTWYLVDETKTVVLTSRHPADSTVHLRRDALREYVGRHLRRESERPREAKSTGSRCR